MSEESRLEKVLTVEGKKNLELELKQLIEVERPIVIEEIKDARAQGDLSENAEFDAAREKQGLIEDRIKEIEDILATHKVTKNNVTLQTIVIGSKVKIEESHYVLSDEKQDVAKFLASHQVNGVQEFTIVSSLEADPFENKISNLSPIGVALLGKELGDVVTIECETEDRKKYKYNLTIKSIQN